VRRAGLLAAIVYPSLALAASFFYPLSYSPLRNWLSDFGNTLVNTKGGILYNAGCVATGLLLMVFYIGMNAWRTGDRVLGRLLSIGQASGIFASLALILAAVFNIGTYPLLHSRFSMLLTIGLTWFLSFANTALLRHPGFKKWMGIYGLVAAAVTLVYGVFFNTPLGEWIAIGMFMSDVVLLSRLPAAGTLQRRALMFR
jgi:hypothetical membrane protein